MSDNKQQDQIKSKLLALLKKINRSAQHYWVNPPEQQDQNWRAGWVDNLLRPKVWFCESRPTPEELAKVLEKAILSK